MKSYLLFQQPLKLRKNNGKNWGKQGWWIGGFYVTNKIFLKYGCATFNGVQHT